MANELAGKVAIITGGARGIGRASVELFIEEGAKVVIADVVDDEGEALAKELGSAARFKRTDVSKKEEVQALVDFAVSEFGGLHIMFNNAGIGDGGTEPFLEWDFSSFHRVIDVNLLGVIWGSQLAARHMAKNGGGSIINTSSIAGTQPNAGVYTYGAAKAGLNNFTQSIAIALGPHLIRCNVICPANIQTSIGLYDAPGATPEQLEKLAAGIKAVRMKYQPLKRQSTGIDIAQAAVFLGSDRSAQITGLIMPVDAGATAGNVSSMGAEMAAARAAALGS
jgi:NAD(P)-dependent dehydrogenase (short-subunit alcohol dehydrogenase family)